jgi:antitoxin ParD1/3/4
MCQGRFEELKREFMIGVQELKRGESFHGREFINRLKANNLQNCGY